MASTTSNRDRANRPIHLDLEFRACSDDFCFKDTNLLHCSACKVVLYCGREHQKQHRPIHKSSCKLIKDARAKYDRERAALENHQGDAMMPTNPFESCVGHFWGVFETRDFMRSYYDLMMATLNIRTGEAVEAALGYGLDMLRLCRGDNMDVRSMIPAIYLRLGQGQEAWDFLKWWAVVSGSYDWGDVEQPYLNFHNEDAFEDYLAFGSREINLSFVVAATNLKARLALDLDGLQRFKEENPSADYDAKIGWLRKYEMSNVIPGRRDIVERGDYKNLAADLHAQVRKLWDRVNTLNKHYWPALHSPESYSHAVPMAYTKGSREEVMNAFRYTWYMWAECDPAFEYIKTIG